VNIFFVVKKYPSVTFSTFDSFCWWLLYTFISHIILSQTFVRLSVNTWLAKEFSNWKEVTKRFSFSVVFHLNFYYRRIKMTKYKSIDLNQALEFVGGDYEFLADVLNDLLNEVNTSEEEIQRGIDDKDFLFVMKAAHRVKGAASSLFCGPLTDVSQDLQMTAKEGIPPGADKKHGEFKGEARPAAELWTEVNKLFEEYQDCAKTFRRELDDIVNPKK
jgi:HPt (histidine-containing phosphotransfer) domain-containing protein